jgi:hypothetical protein
MADEILDGADMIGQLLEKASVSRTSRETLAFFQFLRNVRHQNASEQAELILQASLDPTTASRARKGDSVNFGSGFAGIRSRTPPERGT